ncbi:MAG: hypothetical protein JNK82_45005, partial [Myxococcaceae bacterium]|nr:hypothetical protein [Myxococcaceae bacterium]
PKLKGKQTLFIARCADEVVPPSNSSELAAAAAGDLQTATGASHTGFREVLRDWPATLTGFFEP